jgi:glyoxylase-like metal-dependent hydrolase (beta-lactamase superfamily II)
MQRTRHGSSLTQLTRLPRVFPVNAYFVHEDDGLTLIDTAIGGTAPKFLAAAREIGLPIVRIALTHAHGDHAGSLDALHEALPQAEILFPARDSRFLAGERTLDPAETAGALRGGYVTVTTQPTRLLQPGDRVGSLRVISSPGHTPGHIAFLDERDGTLIAGDSFQTRAGIAVSGTMRPLFPFPAMATWHKPTALETARALRALDPTRLAVGHGAVLTSPTAAMDRAIAASEAALGRQPANVA